MKYLEHPALIKECIQNLHTAAYEKNLHKDEKLPSIKKKIDHNYKTDCWPKGIKKNQLVTFSWYNGVRCRQDRE